MSVRAREETTIYHIPEEALALPLVHLNLTDLFMLTRVCKLWHKVVTSQDEIWKHHAHRKGFYLKDIYPLRQQFNFRSYCEAARKIFAVELEEISSDLCPISEKQMIDKKMAELDKTKLNPLKALAKTLRLKELPIDPFHAKDNLIHNCIQMIPLWIETGLLSITEDIFPHLMMEDSYLKMCHDDLRHYMHHIDQSISNLFNGGRDMIRDNAFITISNTLQPILTLNEYILHFIEKPSVDIISSLCFLSAGVQIKSAWYAIARQYHEQKDPDTEKVFNSSIEIQYPLFLQNILKEMPNENLQTIIDNIPPPKDAPNPCIRFMYEQIHKDLQQSIQSYFKWKD